jgi:hypothetical protein
MEKHLIEDIPSAFAPKPNSLDLVNGTPSALVGKRKSIAEWMKESAADTTDAILDIHNYRSIPALAAYINRIGAQQRNFRTFVVIQENRMHYHFDAIVIKISLDRSDIAVRAHHSIRDAGEFEPTKEEKAAILEALAKVEDWPRAIPARDIEDLKRIIKDKYHDSEPTLFVHRDLSGENVLMVTQRIFPKSGGGLQKADLPWTYWSDGQWRMMEPDGGLPLFGLEKLKNAQRVILYEGAKTARYVQAMLDDHSYAAQLLRAQAPWLSANPWIEDLRGYDAHIGWPGGAPNSHRVDWDPIKKLHRDVEIVIACDHDIGGEEAARDISRLLLRRLSALKVGEQFANNFDMADEFPADLFEEQDGIRKYKGPRFSSCLKPATWATRYDFVSKKFELRNEFKAEWYAITKPLVYVHRSDPSAVYNKEQFNSLVAPFADVQNVAGLLDKSFYGKADELAYEPGTASGLIVFEGKHVVNTYLPSPIVPMEGDPKPFLDFMAHLIPPEEDRKHTLRWCATLIAVPSVRITYGLLLVSENQRVQHRERVATERFSGEGTYNEARTAKMRADARLSEIQLAEKSGKLVDATAALNIFTAAVANIKARLLALPTRCAPRLASKTAAEAHAVLKSEINGLLRAVSHFVAGGADQLHKGTEPNETDADDAALTKTDHHVS